MSMIVRELISALQNKNALSPVDVYHNDDNEINEVVDITEINDTVYINITRIDV